MENMYNLLQYLQRQYGNNRTKYIQYIKMYEDNIQRTAIYTYITVCREINSRN